MRTVRLSITALFLFAFAGAFAQTGKPLMKITVKDGAVVKTESLDPGKGGFRAASGKVSNNGTRASTESGSPIPAGSVISLSEENAKRSAPSVSAMDAANDTQLNSLAQPREVVTSSDKLPKGSAREAKPGMTGYSSLVLDGTARVTRLDRDAPKPPVDVKLGTETIMSEDFEGLFPASGWSAYAQTTDAYWDDTSTRAYEGAWSAWCADEGALPGVPGVSYQDNMSSWMTYGPFDLSDANAASLTFKNFINSEEDYDFFHWVVSTNGTNYYGYYTSGNSGGWVDRSIDLTDVPTLGDVTGAAQVWIAFVFISDETVHNYEGAYVDNVVLQQDVGQPDLHWTFMALSGSNWVPGASVTVDLTEANTGEAGAGPHYTRIYMSDNDIISDVDIFLDNEELYFAPIASGEVGIQSLVFNVPSVADGTYYLGALVDYWNEVAESNEANNGGTRSGTIEVINSPPDLYWTNLALNSSTWSEGDEISADLTEGNIGAGPAGAHTTRLYLSDNTSISSTDLQLGGDMSFGSIGSGSSQTVSQTFTVPSTPDGIYYMGAIVDYYNDIAESDETNNNFYRNGTIEVTTPVYYELYGVSMGLSTTTWVVGSTVTAYFTEGNSGTGQTIAHNTRLYLSSDGFISESEDLMLGSDLSYSSINSGEEQMQPGIFTVPAVPDGLYYIGATIDYYNVVPESNESNNTVYLPNAFTVLNTTTPPDLHWTSLTFDSDSWNEGGTVGADLTVANSGDGDAAEQSTRLYLSTNDIISGGDTQLGSDILFSVIAAQDQQTQSFTFTAPAGDGVYWVGALVDYYGEVAETDEENNGGARDSQVTLIPTDPDYKDIAPWSLYFSTEEWFIGNTIDAEFTETNQGTLPAEAHSSRLVLSDNIVITETDLTLGPDITFGSSNPGDFIIGYSSFTVPDMASGDYYVGVFTDVNDEVTEADESDNIAYRNGTVAILNTVADIGVSPASLTINEPEQPSSATPNRIATANTGKDPFAPNQMIIKFRSNVGSNMRTMGTADKGLDALNAKYKISHVKPLGSQVKQLSATAGNMMVITFDAMTDLRAAIAEYRALSIVEFAEPDYIVTNNADKDFTPSDPLYASQWGLKNTGNAVSYTGQTVGSPGEDINIEDAWNITKGSSGIIVAVIDDGVDLSHAEFAGRLVQGYDFVNEDNDPNPLPTDGHGNACAGIIAAADDGVGVVGVAPDVRIMPLKVLQDGSGFHSDIIPAIYYAVDNGARVISMSLGGTSSSLAYESAVNYAVSNGVVVLAAAGNDNVDNLIEPHYPASYASVISVGAMSPCGVRKTPSTCDGEFWWGSNFGNLDFITPGTRIATTDVTGTAGYTPTDYSTTFNGTSAATPFASGVAALILSLDPSLSPAEVRQIMQASAVDVGAAGYDADNGHGRVNAYAALQLVEGGGGSEFVTITNEGDGILSVTDIASSQPWLIISGVSTPTELSAGESAVLTVTIDWEMLNITGNGEISISSSDSDEPLIVVPVTANPGEVETFDITVSANPSQGGTTVGGGSYAAGQTAVVIANPGAQYMFNAWTDNGVEVSYETEYAFTVTGDRALVANFVPATYSISVIANPSDGGIVQGAGEFTVNDVATLTATPLGDYSFLNWTEDDEVVANGSQYTFAVLGNRSLVANFAVEFYSIDVTVDPPNAGTVAGAGNYGDGQTAGLAATPVTGFQFESWKEDGNVVSTDPNYVFGVTGNRSLLAQFVIESRTVTVIVNPAASGSVTGAGIYEYGQTANLLASPAIDYGFVNWSANGIELSTNPSYSFTVTTDVTVVANFQLEQTITFEPLSPKIYGDAPFELSASASSLLPVSFSSSNGNVLQINGSTATIIGSGTTNVTAYQSGDAEYKAAQPISHTLTVGKANQTITFDVLSSMTISDAPMALTATSTSGLPVTYASSNTAVAIINGSTAVPAGLGSTSITASQAGDANHNAATSVSQPLQVTKGTQIITFDAPAPRTFGDQPFDIIASASSGLQVSFTSSNINVATVFNNTVTIVGGGTTTLTATQAGNNAYDPATAVTRTLVVNRKQQNISFTLPTEMKFTSTPITLNGTTSSGLTITYSSSNINAATIVGNTLTLRGVGVTTITASQAGDNDYNSATNVQVNLLVRKGDQIITFTAVTERHQGGPDFDLEVSVSSGLSATLTSSDPSRVQITGRTVKILQPGAVTILATHSGNANYNSAVSVSRSFCIIPARPTITISNQLSGFPTLTSSSAIGNQWFRGGTELTGANESTFVTTAESERGSYTVQVKIETCQSELSESVTPLIMGMEDAGSTLLTVYPNPFVDEIHIDVSGFAKSSPATVKMYDVTGRMQRTAKGSGVIRLEAAGLSSGSYLVQIEVDDRVVTKRVVKVK